jgi:hypothetical protein
MEECLSKAAEIRRRLEGRRHGDSAELAADDSNGTSDDSLADRELELEDLLANVTNENLHPRDRFRCASR